jgi:hypothetical protein
MAVEICGKVAGANRVDSQQLTANSRQEKWWGRVSTRGCAVPVRTGIEKTPLRGTTVVIRGGGACGDSLRSGFPFLVLLDTLLNAERGDFADQR